VRVTRLAAPRFFGSRSLAVRMAAEGSGTDTPVERLAEMFRRVFPDSVMEYAGMERAIGAALQEVEAGRRRSKPAPLPVGRNGSCPCASGRKFKKRCRADGRWD